MQLFDDSQVVEYRDKGKNLNREERNDKLDELRELRIQLQDAKCLVPEDQNEMFRVKFICFSYNIVMYFYRVPSDRSSALLR